MDVDYDDQIGWLTLEDALSADLAASILDRCQAHLGDLGTDLRVGDKPASGTRRLVDVTERTPETVEVLATLKPVIGQIIGDCHELVEDTYRCPQPGFGAQKLHADDVPRLAPGPNLCATAIVPLVEFTERNGSTRLVPGSNHRLDLQRRSGNLDQHRDEIQLVGPVGRAFVFCGHTLHSGTENRSSSPRPALQFVFRVNGPAAASQRR